MDRHLLRARDNPRHAAKCSRTSSLNDTQVDLIIYGEIKVNRYKIYELEQ